MYDTYIFDVDGTLGDTLPLCVSSFQKALRPILGRIIPSEEILAMFGPSEEGIVQRLVPDRYDEALASYYRFYREDHSICSEPFPGIRDLLDWLAGQNQFLAAVTGKGKGSAAITMGQYGLTQYFPYQYFGGPAGANKVDNILLLLQEHRRDPAGTVYFGDVVSDIRAARATGIAIFSAAWAPGADTAALAAEKPDQLFTTVEECLAFLQKGAS